MKNKICLTLFSLWFTVNILGQTERSVGFSFASFGQNLVTYKDDLIGAPGFDRDRFLNFGVQYAQSLTDWLDLETGLEYGKHYVIINPNLPPDVYAPDRKIDFSLLEIPVTLKANFFKDYFFVKGGALIDINLKKDRSIDDFTGLGIEGGFGLQYRFDFGGVLYANPYFRVHNILPFTSEDTPQNLLESGIKMGLLFKFN